MAKANSSSSEHKTRSQKQQRSWAHSLEFWWKNFRTWESSLEGTLKWSSPLTASVFTESDSESCHSPTGSTSSSQSVKQLLQACLPPPASAPRVLSQRLTWVNLKPSLNCQQWQYSSLARSRICWDGPLRVPRRDSLVRLFVSLSP